MGTWHLEVFRMFLYISFPVGIFHYINQPETYERWILKLRETEPGPSEALRLEFKKYIKAFNDQANQKKLELMESQLKEKKDQ